MRSTGEAIAWYKTHETKGQIGFDPDGMCLKICRTARGISNLYPSAVAAQVATPARYRVHGVADIKKGMVVYYDDPNDSNRFGHIVTCVGRVPGSDPSKLSSLLVRTNSVQRDRIVVVRGDYFPRFWGDSFQFAATWLNGQAFPDFEKKPEPKPQAKPQPKPETFPSLRKAVRDLEESVAYHRKHNHPRIVEALEKDIAEIRQTIQQFS